MCVIPKNVYHDSTTGRDQKTDDPYCNFDIRIRYIYSFYRAQSITNNQFLKLRGEVPKLNI